MTVFAALKKLGILGTQTYQADKKGEVAPSSPTQEGLHEAGTKSGGMV